MKICNSKYLEFYSNYDNLIFQYFNISILGSESVWLVCVGCRGRSAGGGGGGGGIVPGIRMVCSLQ